MPSQHSPGAGLRSARNLLTAVAIPLLAVRAVFSCGALPLPTVLIWVTFVATASSLIGALATGWLAHAKKLKARAEAAEWEAARLRRANTLLDGEEDQALWESVPAGPIDADTCGFGVNVVAINQYRYPRAG